MRIFIRVDASFQIGTGHVMRCLTLADELKRRGASVMFVCREFPGTMISLIENKGFQVTRLHQPKSGYPSKPDEVAHASWLGVPWEQDAENTIASLEEIKPQWLIVDHYAIDRRWQEMLRPYVNRIMVIDDLADRPHDCDLLLDQNLYESMEHRYDNLAPDNCKRLLGPRYALLRPEFSEARKNLRQRDGVVRRVLVFLGGFDPANETNKVLMALAGIIERKFVVDVVVGDGNPYKDYIRDFCTTHDGFNCHSQVNNMAELIAAADLAIGAGGSTTWERCALGLPGLLVSLAENQSELVSYGAARGLFFMMGSPQTVSVRSITEVVRTFLLSPQNLQAYSQRCLETVDAKGLKRVAKEIMLPRIAIRQALADDCDAILEWRNDEETRKHIFSTEPIPVDVHRQWFFKNLNNPDRIILIGEIDSRPVGVVRYDIKGDEALISIYLVPGGQGQGVGTELIRIGTRWLKENCPMVKAIIAEILSANIASKCAFEQAGYAECHVTYKEVLS